jgi:hypothetical protein
VQSFLEVLEEGAVRTVKGTELAQAFPHDKDDNDVDNDALGWQSNMWILYFIRLFQ